MGRVEGSCAARRGRTLDDLLGEEPAGAVAVFAEPGQLPKFWREAEAVEATIGSAQRRRLYGESLKDVKERASVGYTDTHLDARLFPSALPHASGSLHWGEGGRMGRYQKHHLASLDPWFRTTPLWVFFQLDRKLKNDLYFAKRRELGLPAGAWKGRNANLAAAAAARAAAG